MGISADRPRRGIQALGETILVKASRDAALHHLKAFAIRNRTELGAIGFFLLIALAVTYPLVIQFSSHLAVCCDSWLYYWYNWWRSETLLGRNGDPFYTDFIYYPNGTPLYFESMFNSLASLPLTPVLGGITTYNLLFLLTYVLGAFGTYLLVLRLTGNRMAGVVAGVVFIFAPVRNQYLQFTNMSTIQWIPFLALWFLKTIDHPTVKNAFVSAVFFLLVVLVSGYYVVSSAIMLLVILVWNVRRVFNKEFAKALAVFGLASAAMTLPFVYPVLLETLSGESVLKRNHDVPWHSADIFSFILPPRFNPVYDQYVSHIYPLFMTSFTEWVSYVGVVATLLALVGIFKCGLQRIGLWLATFFVFVALSLGPHPQVLGKEFQNITLPFYYLQDLPLLESMGSPKRFLVTAMLALAVLAGYGSAYLFKEKIRSSSMALVVMTLLVALVVLDFWGQPRQLVTTDASVPQFFHELARDERDIAILHIPITSMINPTPLYYQTVHGKRLIGGYVERPSPEAIDFIQDNSFLSSIGLSSIENNTGVTSEQAADARILFAEVPEITYVVFTKKAFYYAGDSPNAPTERKDIKSFAVYEPWLESSFGSPVFEDDVIAVYQVK